MIYQGCCPVCEGNVFVAEDEAGHEARCTRCDWGDCLPHHVDLEAAMRWREEALTT